MRMKIRIWNLENLSAIAGRMALATADGKWKIRKASYWLTAVGLLLSAVLLLPSISSAITASEILEQVDDLWRGESSFAEMSMDVVTEHYERSMKLKAWSLGKEYSLFIITYPPKDRGVATLKAEQDIWNYLPRVNRVIRVPTSMMMANWMGSHFTNDDLVKESRMSDDYESEVTFEGSRDGSNVYELTLIPKPDAPVVWGRIEITVIQETLIPTRSLYYDEDGGLSRKMFFEGVKTLGGRLVPTIMILIPEDKPDEKTVITYDSLELGLGLKPDFFSRSTLTRKDLVR
jgi:outer membrane lipoprotein-sorting protein